MMNTVKLPTQLQSASSARVSGQEGSAMSMLGEQLIQDPSLLQQNPELAQLLENAPEGTSFDDLLAQIKNGDVANETIDPKLLAQMSKNQLDQNAIAIGETNPNLLENTQQNNIPFAQDQLALQNGQAVQSAQNVQQGQIQAQAPQQAQILTPQLAEVPGQAKNVNAEDASRSFMPERKSMFAVPKQQAPQVAQGSQTQVQAQAKANNGLMDFNTFMNKQTGQSKVNMAKSAYAGKSKNASMFAKKIEASAPTLTGSVEQPTMKVTDLMLMHNEQAGSESGMEFSQGQNNLMKANGTNQMQTTKVFDMNQLTQTGNQDVINQIQDYIIQAKATNQPTVQMSFAHDELGMVDLVVQKAHGDQVSIMINTHSVEGNKFFTKNHSELMQTLTQSGINVADLKLDSSSNTNSNANSNSQDENGENNSRNSNQHASDERQQRNEDSERRQELWDLLNKEAA